MDAQYQSLASAGIIGVVCHATSINATTAATGCRALCSMARNADNQIKIKIEEKGGIDAILEAMRTHRGHPPTCRTTSPFRPPSLRVPKLLRASFVRVVLVGV